MSKGNDFVKRRHKTCLTLIAILLLSGCSNGSDIPKTESRLAKAIETPETVLSGTESNDSQPPITPVDDFDWDSLPSEYHEPENFVIPSSYSDKEWQLISCRWVDAYSVLSVFRGSAETHVVLYEAQKEAERVLCHLAADAPVGPILIKDKQIHVGQMILSMPDYQILREPPSASIQNNDDFYSFASEVSYAAEGETLHLITGKSDKSVIDTASPGESIEPMGWSDDGSLFNYWITRDGKRRELRVANAKGEVVSCISLQQPDCEAYWSDDNTNILLRYPGVVTMYNAFNGEMTNSNSTFPQLAGLSIRAFFGSKIMYSIPESDGKTSLHLWDITGLGDLGDEVILEDADGTFGICFTHPGSWFVHTGDAAYLRVERICY